MFVCGALTLDILLGDVRSLKQKRAVVRPIVAEVRRKFPPSPSAEAGPPRPAPAGRDRGRGRVGDRGNCVEVLDACERLVAGRPEIELLSARQRLFNDGTTDESEHGAEARAVGPYR